MKTPSLSLIRSGLLSLALMGTFSLLGGTAHAANTPPSLNGDIYMIAQGDPFNQQLAASDPDAQTLTYTVKAGSTLPAGLTLSSSGLLSGTPTIHTIDNPIAVYINVSDGVATSTALFNFFIREANSLVVNYTGANAAYDGQTTLSEALTFAQSNPDPSVITFDLPAGNRTIALSSALPSLTTPVSINGPSSGGNVTILRSTANGTGLFRIFTVANTTVNLSNLILSGGVAVGSGQDANGGAVYNNGGTLTLTNCTLSGNSANLGGALYNSAGLLTVANSTVANNTAVLGGGVYNYSTDGNNFGDSSTTLRNSTIYGNTSTGSVGIDSGGGGVFNNLGKTVIDSCTIVGNKGPQGFGAGLASYADDFAVLNVSNSIIAGNFTNDSAPTTNTDVQIIGAFGDHFTSNGTNLIGDGDGAELFSSGNDRTGIADSNLKLGTLTNNGGPTETLALLPGSPAINTGSTDLTTDQRGFARPQGAVDDIGAFEQYPDTTVPAVTVTSPTQNQALTIAGFNSITGGATDNVGVSGVTIKLFRVRNNVTEFWNGSSFGTAQVLLPTVLANPGALSTNWTYTVSPTLKVALDNGAYLLAVYGQDAAGNVSGAVGRNFTFATDSTAPTPVISTPAQNQTVTVAAFNAITGSATDNIGVSQVLVKLFRTRNGVTTFWNGSSFGAAQVQIPATLSSPGATSTGWNFPISSELKAALDEGAYSVVVYGKDAAGNQSGAIGRNFTINNDVVAPVPTIVSPSQNQSLTIAAFNSVTGNATDAVGVTQVLVKLFRVRSGVTQFWNGSSFGATQVLLPATLTNPGATSTGWSFAVTPELKAALDSGAYLLTAYGKDAAGNQSGAIGRNFNLTASGPISAPIKTTPSGASS